MVHNIPKFDQLIDAALQGRTEDVRELMKGCPRDQKSVALRRAAQYGYVECVRLLIPVSDPKAYNSLPLQWACQNNDQACFDLLYPLSGPHAALKNLAKDPDRPAPNMRLLHERIEQSGNTLLLKTL